MRPAHWVKSWNLELILLLAIFLVGLLFVNRPPVFDDILLGDDLEVWNASQDGRYASTLQESIRNTSLDKWRPVNTTAMIAILRVFDTSYASYYWFSTFLILVVLLALYSALRVMFSTMQERIPKLALVLSTSVVASSPFTYFGRSGVFGFLEFAPLILCLFSFTTFQRAKRYRSRRLLIYSALIALVGGLIHERYLVFSIVMASIVAWHSRREDRFRGFWTIYLGNVVFYVYSAGVVLGANVLKGGGSAEFNESAGSWIIKRTGLAVLHLFGGAGGESVYFDPFHPEQFVPGMTFDQNYILVLPIAVMLSLLLLGIGTIRELRTGTDLRGSKVIRQSLVGEAGLVALALLIPAATVSNWMESRWLFGSITFFCLAVAALGGAEARSLRYASASVLILLFLGNLFHRDSYSDYDWWRIRTKALLEVVRAEEPSSGYWNIAIVWPDHMDVHNGLTWSLGNGSALRTLDNGPQQILFGVKNQIPKCPAPCLVVTATDSGNIHNDYRKHEFQVISTEWQKT